MEPQPAFSPDNSPEARLKRRALDHALAWVACEFVYPKVTPIDRKLAPTEHDDFIKPPDI